MSIVNECQCPPLIRYDDCPIHGKTKLKRKKSSNRFKVEDYRVSEDPVNHPTHYNVHPSGVECINVIEHFNFCIGNAIKYLWRADSKGKKLEDLKKARWYVDREIQRLENEQP